MIDYRATLIIAMLAAFSYPEYAMSLKTFSEFSRSGRVADPHGAPIQNVSVVAKWETCEGFGHCNTVCSGYEVTQTDRNGNYKITGSHRGTLSDLNFYMSGYSFKGMSDGQVTLSVDPSKGSARIRSLENLLWGCRYDKTERELAGIGRLILDETIVALWDEGKIDTIASIMRFIERKEIGDRSEARDESRKMVLYKLPGKVTGMVGPQLVIERSKSPPRILHEELAFEPFKKNSEGIGFSGDSPLISHSFNGDHEQVSSELKSSDLLNHKNIFGETALFASCMSGHLDIAELLLSHGVDPDIPNLLGETPLLAALKTNHVDIAKQLVRHGATITDDSGRRAVLWAILHNEVELLVLLLESGAPINDEVDGYTPIELAIKAGEAKIVNVLLDRHLELDETQLKSIYNRSLWKDADLLLGALLRNGYVLDKHNTNWPLGAAIQRKNNAAIALLLRYGADANGVLENGRSPLMEAIFFRCEKTTVDMLLEAGANINYADTRNETALSIAAKYGSTDFIRLLIDAGADVNMGSPLNASLYAYNDINNDASKLLIENGAKPCGDKKNLDSDIVAMSIAARKGKIWIIDEYVKNGCAIKDDVHNKILAEAIRGGDVEIVKYVLKLGAKVNHRYKYDVTPLMNAADDGRAWDIKIGEALDGKCAAMGSSVLGSGGDSSRHINLSECSRIDMRYQLADPGIVKLLIAAGAEIDQSDSRFGLTALMRAAIIGNTAIAKLLVESGADPSIKDISGATAYVLANHYGHADVAEVLKRTGNGAR